MDAIRFLKSEHERAKEMFGRIEGADPDQQRQLWQQLAPELKLHEQMEEMHLYGPLAADDSKMAQYLERHRGEVHEAEGLISSLSSVDPSADNWMFTLRRLKSALDEHIKEEETAIWPHADDVWDTDRLAEAGREMRAMKEQQLPRAA